MWIHLVSKAVLHILSTSEFALRGWGLLCTCWPHDTRQGRKDTWEKRHGRALFGLIKPLMVSGTRSFCSSGKANVTCAKPDADDVRRMILLQGGATNRILLKTTAVFKITWLDGCIRFLGTSTSLALENCVLSQFPCWWLSPKQFLKAYIGKHKGYLPPLATNAFISKLFTRIMAMMKIKTQNHSTFHSWITLPQSSLTTHAHH